MNSRIHSLAGVLLLTVPALAAQAQSTNGGFEAGLTGWATIGDASTQAGAPEGARQLWLTTAASAYQDDFPAAAGARNRSGVAAADVGVEGGVERFVGVPIGAVDPNPADGVYAYEGSAARQFVNAGAGEKLSFQWDLGTSDHGQNDVAFVVIDGVLTVLANSSQANLKGVLDNTWRTGFSTFTGIFSTSGPHTIAFGIVDVGDYSMTSTLSIDGVQAGNIANAVPESSGVLMGLAGAGLLAWRFRRRGSEPAAAG